MENKGEIIIYESPDHQTHIEVKFEDETVWLTQKQLADLFHTTPQNITIHFKNIFDERELVESATCKEYLQVQIEGKRKVEREMRFYNLDAILSVGYRINTKRGTQFRQWATQRLKEHLVKGYTLNEKRLKQISNNLSQLESAVKLIQQSGNSTDLQFNEAKGLLEILSNYTQSFILLNQYDSHRISVENLNENITYEIKYKDAIAAILELKNQLIGKKEASELFGNQKDKSFIGILGNIVQTFDGHSR